MYLLFCTLCCLFFVPYSSLKTSATLAFAILQGTQSAWGLTHVPLQMSCRNNSSCFHKCPLVSIALFSSPHEVETCTLRGSCQYNDISIQNRDLYLLSCLTPYNNLTNSLIPKICVLSCPIVLTFVWRWSTLPLKRLTNCRAKQEPVNPPI